MLLLPCFVPTVIAQSQWWEVPSMQLVTEINMAFPVKDTGGVLLNHYTSPAPSVPASLCNILKKYNTDIRLWTHVFHKLLESLCRVSYLVGCSISFNFESVLTMMTRVIFDVIFSFTDSRDTWFKTMSRIWVASQLIGK